ncbi:MAG: rod shape-determining protein [Clostridia bacterium]|nr:rod shape-determining protein [Clostridia bacterium]
MIQKRAGLDLGAANLLATVTGDGIVMRDPAAVAIDRTTGQILYYGAKAEALIGAIPTNVSLFRPFREGIVNELDLMQKVVSAVVSDHLSGVQHVMLTVPCSTSEIEEGALTEVMGQSGIRYPHTVYAPVAALAGSGSGITDMVLSVVSGATVTDIALICDGEIVYMKSVQTAGEAFDRAIVNYIENDRGLKITLRTAESIKMTVGTVWNEGVHQEMHTQGYRVNGDPTPVPFTVRSEEMFRALEEPTAGILEAICVAISHVPTKYVPRVFENGILLSGGTAQLEGLDRMISGVTGVRTIRVSNPVTAVATGTETILNYIGVRGIASVRNLSALYLTKCRSAL